MELLFCDAEWPMSPKPSLIYSSVLWLMVMLACSGLNLSPPVDTPTPPLEPTATPTQTAGLPQPDGDLETVTVAAIIDGDTIELANGRRVRYIGINTPEREQPYYHEATEINRQLVAGRQVQLERDVESIDQYGRILAYVWVDGTMVNLEIVQQGYANS
jgi:micrococcal nuclease